MATRTMRPTETAADNYWREKTARRQHYGVELAALVVFLAIMALS